MRRKAFYDVNVSRRGCEGGVIDSVEEFLWERAEELGEGALRAGHSVRSDVLIDERWNRLTKVRRDRKHSVEICSLCYSHANSFRSHAESQEDRSDRNPSRTHDFRRPWPS